MDEAKCVEGRGEKVGIKVSQIVLCILHMLVATSKLSFRLSDSYTHPLCTDHLSHATKSLSW